MQVQKIIPFSIAILLTALACNQPSDPKNTLNDVRHRGILKAGVSYNPPFVVTSPHDTTGIDIDLLNDIANDLEVKLQLVYGSETEITHRLEETKIDIAAAGFLNKTLFKKKMGLTNWYLQRHDSSYVLGIPKGENAWVMYLEKFIYAHRDSIRQTAQKYFNYESE